MAASYHGDGDGYLDLYRSTHVKLSVWQIVVNFAQFLWYVAIAVLLKYKNKQ